MANQKIFCNVPWTNIHLYWDGSYGVCCSEKERFVTDQQYNIKNMKMSDWYKSSAMNEVRNLLSGDVKLSPCRGCYNEERLGYESRRIKENFKSVIFTEAGFERSYLQSPWADKFESKTADDHPIDWHIDFGNECNLACKMCHAGASSAIAAHQRRHGTYQRPIKTSWSDDPVAWDNFLRSIDAAPVKRIHVMGGEPMLIKRYQDFVDYLIDQGRTEISLSFVTNGTIINQGLLDKLKQFANVDIEISIESIHDNNDYIRQGSKIADLLSNIQLVERNQDEKLQLILRTVPQLLSIHTYADLIGFAWDHQLVIQGIPLIRPDFLAVRVLPLQMRQQLIPDFQTLADRISSEISFARLRTGRGVGTIADTLAKEAYSMIRMLEEPEPENVDSLRKELVKHLQFWDRIYKLDAREYLPHLSDWLQEIGYEI